MDLLFNPMMAWAVTALVGTVSYMLWPRKANQVPKEQYDQALEKANKYTDLLDKYEDALEKNEVLQRNVDTLSNNVKKSIEDKHKAVLGFQKRHKEMEARLKAKDDEKERVCLKLDKRNREFNAVRDELEAAKATIIDLKARLPRQQPRRSGTRQPIFGSLFNPIYTSSSGSSMYSTPNTAYENPYESTLRFRLNENQ